MVSLRSYAVSLAMGLHIPDPISLNMPGNLERKTFFVLITLLCIFAMFNTEEQNETPGSCIHGKKNTSLG